MWQKQLSYHLTVLVGEDEADARIKQGAAFQIAELVECE
jgi:hypothetical protein